jgi:threonine/homoserine/homoserine lactone efflux protein
MAMPPGPVAVAVIKLAIDKGFRQAAFMAIGAGIADLFLCLIAVFAAQAASLALNGFVNDHPIITLVLQAIVILGLLFFGFLTLFSKNFIKKPDGKNKIELRKQKLMDHIKMSGPLLLGVGMASANLANPAFITSLTVVAAQVKKFGLIDNPFWDSIFYSVGFGAGNFLWLLLVGGLVTKYKHSMGDRMFVIVRQVAGIVFLLAGILITWYVIRDTDWSRIG